MPSRFVTVRYPDDAPWVLTRRENAPKIGDTLRRSGGKWLVLTAVEDRDAHLFVTWKPAPEPVV